MFNIKAKLNISCVSFYNFKSYAILTFTFLSDEIGVHFDPKIKGSMNFATTHLKYCFANERQNYFHRRWFNLDARGASSGALIVDPHPKCDASTQASEPHKFPMIFLGLREIRVWQPI